MPQEIHKKLAKNILNKLKAAKKLLSIVSTISNVILAIFSFLKNGSMAKATMISPIADPPAVRFARKLAMLATLKILIG